MKKTLARILALCLAACFCLLLAGCKTEEESGSEPVDWDKLSETEFSFAQISGTDDLGRTITPTAGNEEGKYVGIYYFNWFGSDHANKKYDTSELLEKYENGVRGNMENPLWVVDETSPYYSAEEAPNSGSYYWSEPLYGYYNSEDPWLIRKHLELLGYAQIDYLFLDFSNMFIYQDATYALLDAVLEMQAEGRVVPKITMMQPKIVDQSERTLKYVWDAYFSKEKYEDCWFRGDKKLNPSGNPLLLGSFRTVTDDTYIDNLWLKNMQWPGDANLPDAAPWMSWDTPQYNHDGYMAVSIAQHINAWSSDAYLYPDTAVFHGRGWQYGDQNTGSYGEPLLCGTNFQQQWDYALSQKDSLNVVHVTGWNEWIAGKWGDLTSPYQPSSDKSKRAYFVDNFDISASRDAEMMKGGYGDNYYMQLVENVRQFKGVETDETLATFAQKTIDVNGDFAQWEGAGAKYLDYVGEIMERDFISMDPSIEYKDDSARHDIASVQVTNDAEYLYILTETDGDIAPHEADDLSWMNVYLSVGTGGWENYQYVVNRYPQEGVTSLEKFTGNEAETNTVQQIAYAFAGNKIMYRIPLSALGLQAGDTVQIKATDHLQDFGNPDDFYISGDCAPIGRLNYIYKIA